MSQENNGTTQKDETNKEEKKEEKETGGAGEEPPFIMPFDEVEGGVLLPIVFRCCNRPLQEQVQLLKDLEMRDDDVVVMAYPKCGTHLTWEMVSMLKAGKAEYEKRSKVFSMLEATPIEDLEKARAAGPRVLNTHLPPRLLPRQVKDKKVKVIHAYRNIKDTFVSAFFFYRQIPGAEDLTLDRLEKEFLSGKVAFGKYVTYMKEADDFKKDNPDVPIFTVSFEDMKDDPEKAVGQLAAFLDVEASFELCSDIAGATSFTKMKEADKTKQQPNMPPSEVYRKGEVGDWKNHVTVAQSERFDAAIAPLESCDYHFRYEL